MSEADADLPPCGLYRTTAAIGQQVAAGRLVYFHNHGDPGPGVYLPSGWRQNRAIFQSDGILLPGRWWASTLDPLAPEGFYRVREVFHCCEKRCSTYEAEQMVQLGYNAEAEPLLFVPEVIDQVLIIPDHGSRIDRARLSRLAPLKTPVSTSEPGLQ